MKWFKHFSNARFDPKMRRLINKYGLEGYGLYFLIIESVAFQLETDNPIPDLEETACDIAQLMKGDTLRIQEIIEYCIDQKLLEYNKENGRVICLKLLAHLDNTMSNNPEIKKILINFKLLQETSSHLKQIRVDKIRVDKTIEDKSKKKSTIFIKPTIENIQEYCLEKGFDLDAEHIYDFYESKGWMIGNNKMKDWKAAVRTWYKNKDKFKPTSFQDQEDIKRKKMLDKLEKDSKENKIRS